MLKRVTAVCIEAIPALATRSSHVPGSCARVIVVAEKKMKMKRRNFEEVIDTDTDTDTEYMSVQS